MFSFNNESNDDTNVFIDVDNTVTISGTNVEVNSSGVFTRTFTLTADYVRLYIGSESVGIEPADDSEDPGVRVSDLLLVKN